MLIIRIAGVLPPRAVEHKLLERLTSYTIILCESPDVPMQRGQRSLVIYEVIYRGPFYFEEAEGNPGVNLRDLHPLVADSVPAIPTPMPDMTLDIDMRGTDSLFQYLGKIGGVSTHKDPFWLKYLWYYRTTRA